MELISEIQILLPQLSVNCGCPLSSFTTFAVGGPCPLFIDNPPVAQLPGLIQFLNKHNTPFLIIGQGSNLVISDKGLDCTVIRFCSDTPDIQHDGNRIIVSGNTLLADLTEYTVRNAVGDLTFCTGIPGTVGGGIAGNAGAFGRQMGDHLVSAEILNLDGKIHEVSSDAFEFSYRNSKLKETGEIVLSATFALPPADAEELAKEHRRIIEFRKEHHPDWHTMPCAGSVFRNIEASSAAQKRQAAGWFLEQAGAKEMTAGGASVFEKHANMIIAGNTCTAQDIRELSEQMKQAVQEKFGITLIREVRFLGNFD